MFSWFRERQRRKLLAEPFPQVWEEILRRNVAHYLLLSQEERIKMRQIARILIAEKVWEGCGGLEMTEEIQLTIAAQAALPILGMEHDYYSRVLSIIVYPTAFHLAKPDDTGDEYFVRDSQAAEGQAVYRGPVILSWDEVLSEGRAPELGHNVVIHEFVHQLDFLDNAVDGIPPLESREQTERWKLVMSKALAAHRQALERGAKTFFTEYAAKNEAEFFASASESFFCIPHDLRAEHSDIFDLLATYYHLEPTKWFAL